MGKKKTSNVKGRRQNMRMRKTGYTQPFSPAIVDISDDSNDNALDNKSTLPSTSRCDSLKLNQRYSVPLPEEFCQNSSHLLNHTSNNTTANGLRSTGTGLPNGGIIGNGVLIGYNGGINPSGYHNLEPANTQATGENFANVMFYQNAVNGDANNMTPFVPEMVNDVPIDYSMNAQLQNMQAEPVDLSHTNTATLSSSEYGYNEPSSYVSYPNMADIRRIKSYKSDTSFSTSLKNHDGLLQNCNTNGLQANILNYPFNTLENENPVNLNDFARALNHFQIPCEIDPNIYVLQPHEGNQNNLETSNQFLHYIPPTNVLPYMYSQSIETFPHVLDQSVNHIQPANLPRSRKCPRSSPRKYSAKLTDQMYSNVVPTIESFPPGQNSESNINGRKEFYRDYRRDENLQSVPDPLASYLDTILPSQHAFANVDYSQNSDLCSQDTSKIITTPPNGINQLPFGSEMYRDPNFVERIIHSSTNTSQMGPIGLNQETLRDKPLQSILSSSVTLPVQTTEIGNDRKVAHARSVPVSLAKSSRKRNSANLSNAKKMEVGEQTILNTNSQVRSDANATSLSNSSTSSDANSCPISTSKEAECRFPYESEDYCNWNTSQTRGNESHFEIQHSTCDVVSKNDSSYDASTQDICDILALPLDFAVSEINKENSSNDISGSPEVDAKRVNETPYSTEDEKRLSSPPSAKNSADVADTTFSDSKDSSSPTEAAILAFNKRKLPEFFELIKNNFFPAEHHEKLKDLWGKALVINYHQITGLPCSGRQILLISNANPPPESIAPKIVQVITID